MTSLTLVSCCWSVSLILVTHSVSGAFYQRSDSRSDVLTGSHNGKDGKVPCELSCLPATVGATHRGTQKMRNPEIVVLAPRWLAGVKFI